MEPKTGGYFKGSNNIFEYGLNPYQIAVYLYISRCGNNSKEAYPSYGTIAKKCGMSRPKAIDVVAELECMKLLKKIVRNDQGKNQSNVYEVVEPSKRGLLPSKGELPPSKRGLPYKELDYKEPQYKEEEKIYIDLPIDDHGFLNIYNELFKKKFNKDHMRVTDDQLNTIMGRINTIESYDIDIEEWKEAVEGHFDNLPKKNNGNILAFLQASFRHFEVGEYS